MRALSGLLMGVALLGLVACGRADDTGAPEAEAPAEAAATPAAGETMASTTTPGELEVGFDRPGYDIGTSYDAADAEACRAQCEADEACRAFTWVQAGVQAETPVCWLKDQVPGPVEAEWATSGVMAGREAPATE
ncbi:MAG TPA: PAN domain-containing protein [Brevundimonas sp.]|uniref:PAN domain-containing protein n=1 Tax=Brevundimonas sp. TaxID=1871086 RepID=UPI002CFB8650|nr:PAN domain-containing protein [Brevundimonas sp.]HRH19019.1 PAN domain-containing protein [Brevundimonas sp.]